MELIKIRFVNLLCIVTSTYPYIKLIHAVHVGISSNNSFGENTAISMRPKDNLFKWFSMCRVLTLIFALENNR